MVESTAMKTIESGVWLGLACGVVSLSVYALLYWRNRRDLRALRPAHRLVAVLAHLPNSSAGPWPHIVAGVLGITSLSSLVALGLNHRLFDPSQDDFTLELTNFIFGILLASTSIWTLWQTKRIETNQGVELLGFRGFVGHLSKEMTFLRKNFRERSAKAFTHDRFLLITTNPMFGQLSFPHADEAEDYSNALVNLAHCHAADPMFKMEILCGTREELDRFHAKYLGLNPDSLSDDQRKKVEKLTAAVEAKIEHLNREAQNIVVKRCMRIPHVQFAVVGNTVFDFVLESGDGHTEVHRVRMSAEKMIADRFEEFFRVIESAYCPAGIPPSTVLEELSAAQ